MASSIYDYLKQNKEARTQKFYQENVPTLQYIKGLEQKKKEDETYDRTTNYYKTALKTDFPDVPLPQFNPSIHDKGSYIKELDSLYKSSAKQKYDKNKSFNTQQNRIKQAEAEYRAYGGKETFENITDPIELEAQFKVESERLKREEKQKFDANKPKDPKAITSGQAEDIVFIDEFKESVKTADNKIAEINKNIDKRLKPIDSNIGLSNFGTTAKGDVTFIFTNDKGKTNEVVIAERKDDKLSVHNPRHISGKEARQLFKLYRYLESKGEFEKEIKNYQKRLKLQGVPFDSETKETETASPQGMQLETKYQLPNGKGFYYYAKDDSTGNVTVLVNENNLDGDDVVATKELIKKYNIPKFGDVTETSDKVDNKESILQIDIDGFK